TVSDSPVIYATATAQTSNEPFKKPDLSKTYTGTVNVGVTLAVNVGDYHNDAYAYLAGNAIVDSKGALTVEASPQNLFDPTSTYGSDLATFGDASTYTATYNTTSGTQVLYNGDTVQVPKDYDRSKGGGGTPYKVYTYIGPDGATVDLGSENY